MEGPLPVSASLLVSSSCNFVLIKSVSSIINRVQEKEKDLFELPPLPAEDPNSSRLNYESDSDSEQEEFKEDLLRQLNATDIHHMDVSSREFKSLPKELQYEVLSELTTPESRKQNSWSKMHEMPKSSTGFSGFQMQRLINRRQVQKTKDSVGKEIGDENAMQVDANLFVGDIQGIRKAKAEAKKVVSSSSGSHILYVKDIKSTTSQNIAAAKLIDDDEIEILEPSFVQQASNRSGGVFAIKQEVLDVESEEEEDVYQVGFLRLQSVQTESKKIEKK